MIQNNSKSDISKKNKEIYARLEKVERHFDMSKEEIADIMGISAKSFYNSRSQGRGFRLESLISLLERFRTLNINWLLTGDGHMLTYDASPIAADEEENYVTKRQIDRIEEMLMDIKSRME